MKNINRLSIALAVIGAFLFAAVLLPTGSVSAHNGEDHDEVAQLQNQDQEDNDNDENQDVYKYVAQRGDSYTLLARKAVQTYGIVNKVNLSEAQIVYAETLLTQEAGSPSVSTGQTVEIKEATVKSWVEKAEKLTDAQKTAWNYYAQFANFNTNNVGQPAN